MTPFEHGYWSSPDCVLTAVLWIAFGLQIGLLLSVLIT